MSVDFSGAIYFSPHGYWMTVAMWFFVVIYLVGTICDKMGKMERSNKKYKNPR